MAIINVERYLRKCESPACPHQRGLWRAWREPTHGYFHEGHWYCSQACFEQAIVTAIAPFLPGAPQPAVQPHRVPLGLLMLSRGLVDNDQLKKALKAQKDAGSGRVGEWLRHIGAVSEEQVTQVLGIQWSIPVFPLERSRRYLECAQLVPFPLLELAEMLPVHHLPASQQLYVAFVDHVNYSALYAVDKMLACHTEPCLAVQSHVLQALNDLRTRNGATEVPVSHITDPWEMADAIASEVMRVNATDTRVSGFDGFVWSRIFSGAGFTDLMFQTQKTRPELFLPAGSQD